MRNIPALPLVLVLVLFTWNEAPVNGAIVNFDPALNTLPQAQGFTFVEDPPASPAPSVNHGIFEQGPTSVAGVQFFYRNNVPFSFDTGFTLTTTLKCLASSYDPNAGGPGSQRSGWYMEGIDALGRRFAVGIDSGGVTVNTDGHLLLSNGFSKRPFNTTDAFHQYRLVVSDGTGTLYIDGAAVGTAPVGEAVDPASANRVYFGDGTSSGNSQTQLSFLQYADRPPAASPLLSVAPGMNVVLLTWQSSDTNFLLEATTDLVPPAAWTSVTNEVHVAGVTNWVVVEIDRSRRFFRLNWK